jgi:hypothetical protein
LARGAAPFLLHPEDWAPMPIALDPPEEELATNLARLAAIGAIRYHPAEKRLCCAAIEGPPVPFAQHGEDVLGSFTKAVQQGRIKVAAIEQLIADFYGKHPGEDRERLAAFAVRLNKATGRDAIWAHKVQTAIDDHLRNVKSSALGEIFPGCECDPS